MMNSKLVTVGCSFSDHFHWPTWADCMGHYYDDYRNLGKGGSGNRAIFNIISNALRTNIINTNTDVVVQWSSCLRYDSVVPSIDKRAYIGFGSIYNTNYYSGDFVKNYFNLYQHVHETINYIYTTIRLFKSLGINYGMTFMLDPRIGDFFGEPGYGGINGSPTEDDIKLGHELTPIFDDLIDERFTKSCITNHQLDNPVTVYSFKVGEEAVKDGHPSPMQNYTFFRKYITPLFPEKNFEENSKLVNLLQEWEDWAKIPMGGLDKIDTEPTNWPAVSRYKGGVLFKNYPKL